MPHCKEVAQEAAIVVAAKSNSSEILCRNIKDLTFQDPGNALEAIYSLIPFFVFCFLALWSILGFLRLLRRFSKHYSD